mmetsp:Transcript_24570/g.54012  ORF Transcript_24570/g.54012 Transcript_24570/m.54012 type:complete len:97 (-) Transcript_24570:48-338(-)
MGKVNKKTPQKPAKKAVRANPTKACNDDGKLQKILKKVPDALHAKIKQACKSTSVDPFFHFQLTDAAGAVALPPLPGSLPQAIVRSFPHPTYYTVY